MSIAARVLRAVAPVARRYPRAARLAASGVGLAVWRFRSDTRRRAIRNLLPACDGNRDRARRASREAVQRVARYYAELAWVPAIDRQTFESQYLDVVHPEHLGVLRGPGPVIAVSAHMGNAEVAIQALLGRERPFVAVVEPLADRDLALALLRLRTGVGGTFVEATPRGTVRAVRALREGAVLGLMGDRDLGGDGVCIDLFGRRARLPRGPWVIARRTGATVLPGFCARIGGGRFRVSLEEPFLVAKTGDAEADIVNAATRWARHFERYVRDDPGQWTVLEDFWANHECSGPEQPRESP